MRRGAIVVIVIWAIAIAAAITAAVQLVCFRQATIGRETLARVQARWAARAGIEESIAILEWHAENPDPEDLMAVVRDLEAAADGELATGTWKIRHVRDGVERLGPLDEHSRLNVNRVGRGELLAIEEMTLDVADAIIDWRDEDDEVTGIGAEGDWYRNRGSGYEPRNAAFRNLAELELVAASGRIASVARTGTSTVGSTPTRTTATRASPTTTATACSTADGPRRSPRRRGPTPAPSRARRGSTFAQATRRPSPPGSAWPRSRRRRSSPTCSVPMP